MIRRAVAITARIYTETGPLFDRYLAELLGRTLGHHVFVVLPAVSRVSEAGAYGSRDA